MGWKGVVVLAWVGLLGCSTGRDTERAPPEPSSPAAASEPEAPPAPQPPSADCAGICYREVADGGCESMPTCCPRTVHLKAPPHCPAGYTLDLNSGPERCAVHHLCVD